MGEKLWCRETDWCQNEWRRVPSSLSSTSVQFCSESIRRRFMISPAIWKSQKPWWIKIVIDSIAKSIFQPREAPPGTVLWVKWINVALQTHFVPALGCLRENSKLIERSTGDFSVAFIQFIFQWRQRQLLKVESNTARKIKGRHFLH